MCPTFARSLKFIRFVFVLFLIVLAFPLFSMAADAPGGTVSDAESMLNALGGESAGWLSDSGFVVLRSDIVLNSPITVTGGEIVINGAGSMITRGFDSGSMFIIEEGSLIFGNAKNTDLDDTLIIDGGDETYGQTGSAIEQNGGAIHFYSGTTLQNNNAPDQKGGAVMINGGTFNFYGGYIRFCKAQSGGGVCITGGAFNMTGGQISNCSAAKKGGGIYAAGGEFRLSGGTVGGTVTTEEYATEPYVQSDASNSAEYGGGICFENGIYSLEGGVIACNIAKSGGGIAVGADSEILLFTGGLVYNSADTGGGVYNMGKAAQAYCEIAENSAKEGGGVYNAAGASYYNEEGLISSNKSSKDGAGIYNAGIFEMSGGSVNYNESEMSGGGAVNFGTFRLSGGSYGYNKTPYRGSAMLCFAPGEVVFSNAVFIGGDNDIALVMHEDGTNALLTLSGPFTCTTKVARLSPVVISDGYVLENYIKGTPMIIIAENNEQELDYYLPLFDVPDDSTGGVWHLSGSGKLTPDLPGVWFWATVSVLVLFIAAAVFYVIKNKNAKNK